MEDRLARALGYPYEMPADSYTLRGDDVVTFAAEHIVGRTAVLAYGSNRAPEQLVRKFGGPDTVLPVQRAWLADHDVVYSAHLTAYGSVPAALRPHRGCRVAVAVTWLDGPQLAVMHETEVGAENYTYEALDVVLALEGGEPLDEVFGYAGTRGHLESDGDAIALAEIAAQGRGLPALGQRQALILVRDRLAPEMTLEDFIEETISNRDLRRRRIAALVGNAV
ncbi:MAG: hypothetical protein ACTSX7_00590 [Alphaproteobacteria bacterium]